MTAVATSMPVLLAGQYVLYVVQQRPAPLPGEHVLRHPVKLKSSRV